ncbi:hypothetical protein JCM6882_002665 [Rhodosporidiobolus microsporus]
MPPSTAYSPLLPSSHADDPLSSSASASDADAPLSHALPRAQGARPSARAPPTPAVWLPDPFSLVQRPHPFASSRDDKLGSARGRGREEDEDEDDEDGVDDSDSLSAASSLTAGRLSGEFAQGYGYGGKEADSLEEDEYEGEDARLVREEGALLDPESGRRRGRGWRGILQRGGGGGKKSSSGSRRLRLLLLLLSALSLLLLLLLLLHLLFSPSPLLSRLSSAAYDADGNEIHRHRFEGKGTRKISVEEIKNGTWWTERVGLDWLAEAGDGVFSQRASDGSIVLTDLHANSTRTLVRGSDVIDPETGAPLAWQTFSVAPDLSYILFSTQRTKVWRHSSLSTFFLHRLDPPLTLPLLDPASPTALTAEGDPTTSLAVFAPTGHTVAYVSARDLFVLPSSSITAAFSAAADAQRFGGRPALSGLERARVRVTNDGGEEVFNGVCDWVYEEEVFSASEAVWFSPSSRRLAFLSFRPPSSGSGSGGGGEEGEGEEGEGVPSYDYPIYNPDLGGYLRPEGGAAEYPEMRRLRYPKAGWTNPAVDVRVVDLSGLGGEGEDGDGEGGEGGEVKERVKRALRTLVLDMPFEERDRLVTEVAWVSTGGAASGEVLLVKETTRDAAVERVGLFDLGVSSGSGSEGEEGGEAEGGRDGEKRLEGRVVREVDWVRRDGGWAEPTQNISPLSRSSPSSSSSSNTARPAPPPDFPAYLDLLPSPSGFVHLALFSPLDAAEPAVWLTQGEWEVDADRGILGVDWARGFAYVLAARPSTSRHVLRVSLPRSKAELDELVSGAKAVAEPTQLTGTGEGEGEGEVGVYGASFSPGGGVYLLDYEGPGIPWQKLFKVDDPTFSLALTTNDRLHSLDPLYAHAQIEHSTVSLPADEVTGEKVEVNAMELRPPMMDTSGKTKYPVLFQVYGGPNSQLVSPKFQRDWHHYLCTALGYVIVRVDGRGTGFRGRKFRTTVRGRLGEVEARDVVETGRIWSKKPYIDEKRVGIWGWSYGGFLTTKVIETNSSVFQLGMAVAPVTDWRYYDSIYTERYMSTPQLNPQGYLNSSIHEMDGFKHATYAVAHGTGDDNVHFQNTINLLDRFTIAGVRDYHLRVFADSDHSISTRNAYWELMAWLESLLLEHFGVGGRTKQRWKLTAGEPSERE